MPRKTTPASSKPSKKNSKAPIKNPAITSFSPLDSIVGGFNQDIISISGVRTHNLRNIDLQLPKNKIITITGVSGSGKSSLAFDTIYKEGQYRYIESLSSYLRQFFNLGERPDLDSSSGLSPAIAIEQNKRVGNARSTVGTLTEIDDYLRLLYAKLGKSYCYNCGNIIKAQTVDTITQTLRERYQGKKVYLVEDIGSFQDTKDFLKFVKKNRIQVENGGGFTRFLVVMSNQIKNQKVKIKNDESNEFKEEGKTVMEVLSNISFSSKKKGTAHGPSEDTNDTQAPTTFIDNYSDNDHSVEYFYLESPNIHDKFFPVRVYGIFDRVTLEDKKLARLQEDIIKILSRAHKFGVYAFNPDDKQDRNNEVGKSLDKEVYKAKDVIQRFTDKNICANCNIIYPEFASHHFSSNRQEGACEHCHGLGEVLDVDVEKVLDPHSPYSKAVLPWRDSVLGQTILSKLAQKYSMDVDKPWKEQPERFKEVLINGDGELLRLGMQGKFISMHYKGIQDVLTSQYNKGILTVDFQSMLDMQPCPVCHGAKLRRESLNVFLEVSNGRTQKIASVQKYNIFDLQHAPIEEMVRVIDTYKETTDSPEELVRRITTPLLDRAKTIEHLGLSYLSLTRQVDTLSGGEIQRLRLAKQLGNKLTGIIYVLDEPTIGLDTGEVRKMVTAIKGLKAMGNTIIVVEHNDEFIKESDWVVEIGPGAGDFGGNLVFSGPYEEFIKGDSLTAQFVKGKRKVKIDFEHSPNGRTVSIKKASQNNLKAVDVELKLGAFTIVTGPSGAGKTTLMYDTFFKFLNDKQKFIQSYIRLQLLKKGYSWNDIVAAPVLKKDEYEHYEKIALQEFHKSIKVETIRGHEAIENVIYVDQSSIGKTPRSCPATFIGVFDHMRKIFAGVPDAQYLGFGPGHFSFNSSKGSCTECEGYGYKKIELQFLPDTYIPCPLCHGKRYKPEVLGIKWHDKSISDVLEMYVVDAVKLFEDIHFIKDELQLLVDIGLGYLRMGQPAHTLSGGESQRLKLSRHLIKSYKGHTVYFLDEPTVGLHPQDIERLLQVLKKFLDNGDTILMIEHDKHLIGFADYVIRLEDGKVVKS